MTSVTQIPPPFSIELNSRQRNDGKQAPQISRRIHSTDSVDLTDDDLSKSNRLMVAADSEYERHSVETEVKDLYMQRAVGDGESHTIPNYGGS